LKLKVTILMTLVLCLFITCKYVVAIEVSGTSAKKNSIDQLYEKKIIGRWSEGFSPYGISVFREGGIYEGMIYDSPTQNILLLKMKGKWWIKNLHLYTTAPEMTPAINPNPEEVTSDDIVEITDNKMILTNNGKRIIKSKIK